VQATEADCLGEGRQEIENTRLAVLEARLELGEVELRDLVAAGLVLSPESYVKVGERFLVPVGVEQGGEEGNVTVQGGDQSGIAREIVVGSAEGGKAEKGGKGKGEGGEDGGVGVGPEKEHGRLLERFWSQAHASIDRDEITAKAGAKKRSSYWY